MKLSTRFPTIIGIFLFLLVFGGIVYTVEKIFRTDTNASGSREPKNVRVSNVSGSSFTVSWTTELPTSGALLVTTKGKSNRTYADERDTTGKLGAFNSHRITVGSVMPETEYFATILVNGKKHILKEEPLAIRTPSSLPLNTGGLEPAYGIVMNADGSPSSDALIHLTLEGGQELSTLTKPTGGWIIPLNQSRTADLTSFLPVVERMDETIQVFSGELQSYVTTDTLNDSPLPEVLLGKEYDFKKQQAKKAFNNAIALREPTQAARSNISSTPAVVAPNVLGDTTTKNHQVSITEPKDGSSLSSLLPFIQGTGVPGKFIGISVGLLNPSHGSVQVSANGTWSFTPKKSLAPGKQGVTITSVNSSGKAVAITHMFTLFKSGTQVLGDATPSASISPTITEAPTIDLTPTPESTIAGTPPPISGNELPTLILLLIGVAFIAGGSSLAYKK